MKLKEFLMSPADPTLRYIIPVFFVISMVLAILNKHYWMAFAYFSGVIFIRLLVVKMDSLKETWN